MAPETANQKRKRGRPPMNASRDDQDNDASAGQSTLTRDARLAAPREAAEEGEMAEETPRPRKRGRPSKVESTAEAQPDAESEQQVRGTKRRKRQGAGPQAGALPEIGQQEQDISTTRRGRPSKKTRAIREKETEIAADEADDENEGDSSILRRSGRERKSVGEWYSGIKDPVEKGEHRSSEDIEEGKSGEGSSSLSRRRGWKKAPADEDNNGDVKAEISRQGGKTEAEKSGKKHPRHQDDLIQQKAPEPKKKKRGRPSLDAQPPAEAVEGEPTKRGRARRSDGSSVISKKSRRPSNRKLASRSPSPESVSSPPPYQHLTTRTRRVPLRTVNAKWTPLDPSSVSSVVNMLQTASRPVLLRLTNIQRHGYATAALNTVSNRLRSRLTRGMPFPPATTSTKREDELEFERTISGIQALESQLDPLIHGVELLKREKEHAEKELKREYKYFNRLSANARSEARERRDRMRKMHVLVPDKPYDNTVGADRGVLADCALLTTAKSVDSVFSGLPEGDDIRELAGQLGNHMETMRGNLQQIDGVVPEIAKAQALLRVMLRPHLDEEQMEHILLGPSTEGI